MLLNTYVQKIMEYHLDKKMSTRSICFFFYGVSDNKGAPRNVFRYQLFFKNGR